MGSPEDEPGRSSNEMQREVEIASGFWMAATPVTRAQFQAVVAATGTDYPDGSRDNGEDKHPMTNVSCADAKQFCEALGAIPNIAMPYEPGSARLPTEEEWEYACRAGTTGSRYGDLDEIAHYASEGIAPVGTKKPNAWGLYDMIGNVREWASTIQANGINTNYAVLGGSWYSYDPASLRAADRVSYAPADRFYDIGFRFVVPAGPAALRRAQPQEPGRRQRRNPALPPPSHLQSMTDLSLWHAPCAAPNTGGLRAAKHELGFIVFVCPGIDKSLVPPWLKAIHCDAVEHSCILINFDRDAFVAPGFEVYEW